MDMNVVEDHSLKHIPNEHNVFTQLTTECVVQTTDDKGKDYGNNCEKSKIPDEYVKIEQMLVVSKSTKNDGCSNGKCLCLDCGSSSDENRFSQSLHKMIILGELQKLRRSLRKHICSLDGIHMPKKDKIYLRMQFTANLIKADEFMIEITRTCNLPCTLQFYVNMFQLEAQFNENLQRYNDILTCLSNSDTEENQGICNQFVNHFYLFLTKFQTLLFN